MQRNNRKEMNEIFKNLINNIFSEHSKLYNRYKFLNAFWLIEKNTDKLKSKLDNSKTTKISNIIKLFKFTKIMIEKEIEEKMIEDSELIFLSRNLIKEMEALKNKNDKKEMINPQKDLILLLEISKKILRHKQRYCDNSFVKLKVSYNHWIISSIDDIDSINNFIYHFISTRLMWGWSLEYVRKTFFSFSKDANFWSLDFIQKMLVLQTKHKRQKYNVFIPIETGSIEQRKIWIENFNSYNGATQIIDVQKLEKFIDTEAKTCENLQNIKMNSFYISYEIDHLDEFSAINEGIKRIIPTKLGIISALESHINISKNSKIIVLSKVKEKQWFSSYYFDNLENYYIFMKDFIVVPELKLKTIFEYDSTKLLKNIFSFIYNNEDSKISENKYMATYLLLENSTSFVKSLNFDWDAHKTLIQIAMIDVVIHFYINNAFIIEKDFLDKCEYHSNNKINNKLSYLEFYLNNKECYLLKRKQINLENNNTSFFTQWTTQNCFPSEKEIMLIRESLKYFKDIASQIRHKIMHEGKKTNFFDHLVIETLDSILTLSIIRLVNKNIKNDDEVNEQWKLMKKAITENKFNIFKKVI